MSTLAEHNAAVEPWLLEIAQALLEIAVRTNRGEFSCTFAGYERVRIKRINGKGLVAVFPSIPSEERST